MKLAITAILIGNLIGTSYRSVPEQTDDSPNFTATGEHVCTHGIAISQDLLKKNGGLLEFGDLVYIDTIGFKTVNDTMNKRMKKRFDVWVGTYKEEREFDRAYKNRKFKVWLVKSKEEGDNTDVKSRQGLKRKIWKIE